ncbi:MAG: TetR/AcrR family transcriptional regulator [Ignavibacteria bacterium]|nr:TetR/AcrR family transcriptional regulator [Ignavibacteria bacterium]
MINEVSAKKTANPIPEDKLKVLNYAQERFFKEGFYKITMDEISKELSMSKSTLYKHFPSKMEMLDEAIFLLISGVKGRITSVIASGDNAVDKFITVIRVLTATITKFSDKFMSDLQHHAPQLWTKVDETRRKLLYENISKIIIQGQKEELIKKYPPELIITLITGGIRGVVNPQFLISTRFSYNDAVHYAFKILLNGILTEKGQLIFNRIKL